MPLFVSERGSRHERIWEQVRTHLGADGRTWDGVRQKA